MIGLTDLLLETALSNRQRGCVLAVRNCAMDLLERIAPAPGSPAEGYEFNLSEALATAVRACSALAEAKGTPIAVVSDPALPETVVGDGRSVVQLAIRLIADVVANCPGEDVAVHASMGPGGLVVRVSTPEVPGPDNIGFISQLAALLRGLEPVRTDTTAPPQPLAAAAAVGSRVFSLR